MSRRPCRLLPALLLAVLLSGCGSEQDRYCGALQADRARLADMFAASSPGALVDELPLLRDLASRAPSDLTDEWQSLLNAVEGLRDAMKRGGVTTRDFADQPDPPGLGAIQRRAIAGAASGLATREVVSAATGIEQQALDVCKVALGT